MAKWKIEKLFKELNEENFRLIINFRKSLYWNKLKEDTVYTYSKDVQRFLMFLQNKNITIQDATLETLEEYIDSIEAKAQRKLKVISSINIFYKYLRKKRLVRKNIVEDFDTKPLRTQFKIDEYVKKDGEI